MPRCRTPLLETGSVRPAIAFNEEPQIAHPKLLARQSPFKKAIFHFSEIQEPYVSDKDMSRFRVTTVPMDFETGRPLDPNVPPLLHLVGVEEFKSYLSPPALFKPWLDPPHLPLSRFHASLIVRQSHAVVEGPQPRPATVQLSDMLFQPSPRQ